MPAKPKPRPEAELAVVRKLTAELADAEKAVDDLRARRNRAMVIAKAAGATGDHLAEAANMARRNAVQIVRQLGDPNAAEE